MNRTGTRARSKGSATKVSMTLVPMQKSAGVAEGRKRRDLLELAIGYGLILIAVWSPPPWQKMFNWIALGSILLITGLSFDGWRAMGLRVSGPLRSLWVVGLASLLVAGAIILASRLHTLHLPGSTLVHPSGYPIAFLKHFWGYAIWAFIQEFLLLDFILLRLLRLHGRNTAVLAAAGLFALAHLPNPVLAPVTLLWGLTAGWLFLEYRNVYTLGMAHALFGICMCITVPAAITHNMKVGLGYLTYRPHAHRHRSQNDHTVSTQAWVITEAPTRRS